MTSNALKVWQEDRSRRLDHLVSAHHRMGGAEASDAWGIEELLAHAVLLRLAAEFQGFCRSLHDECVRAVVAEVRLHDPRLALIVGAQNMESGRRLDSGNATKENISHDFLRFGLRMWVVLEAVFPQQVREWLSTVHLLNLARNGIVHDVEPRLDQLRRDGHSLLLSTAQRWRSSLDDLATAMDTVCSAHLRELLPEVEPW